MQGSSTYAAAQRCFLRLLPDSSVPTIIPYESMLRRPCLADCPSTETSGARHTFRGQIANRLLLEPIIIFRSSSSLKANPVLHFNTEVEKPTRIQLGLDNCASAVIMNKADAASTTDARAGCPRRYKRRHKEQRGT